MADFSYTIHLPTKMVTPTPANGDTNVIWDSVFKWATNDDFAEDGPYVLNAYPYVSTYLYKYRVYMATSVAVLNSYPLNPFDAILDPVLPRTTTQYTLRNPNTQRYNANDVDLISPFYEVTVYWRVDAINQWGTTTGDVWSFTIAPEGYVPPTDPFPEPRPDPPDDDPYPGMSITGGGRFGTTLLAISDNDDVGVLYYRVV